MNLNSKLTINLCCLLLMIMTSVANKMSDNQKSCGDVLNQALDILCLNGFSKRLKRDLHFVKKVEYAGSITKTRFVKGWKRSVYSLVKPHLQDGELRRPRRRIVHDCCENECTYDDIMAYCK